MSVNLSNKPEECFVCSEEVTAGNSGVLSHRCVKGSLTEYPIGHTSCLKDWYLRKRFECLRCKGPLEDAEWQAGVEKQLTDLQSYQRRKDLFKVLAAAVGVFAVGPLNALRGFSTLGSFGIGAGCCLTMWNLKRLYKELKNNREAPDLGEPLQLRFVFPFAASSALATLSALTSFTANHIILWSMEEDMPEEVHSTARNCGIVAAFALKGFLLKKLIQWIQDLAIRQREEAANRRAN